MKILENKENPANSNTFQTQKNPTLPQQVLVLGESNSNRLLDRLSLFLSGKETISPLPASSDIEAFLRLSIAFQNDSELKIKAEKAYQAFLKRDEKMIGALQNQGIFLGQGKHGKIAFLFPGQGSQYLNMARHLREHYPVVSEVFEEADRIMSSMLDKKLSEYIFISENTPEAMQKAEQNLKFAKITQPAVLAVDIAIFELLKQHGIQPDMVIGHSLGEYAALVAAGVISFENAMIAVCGRAKEMSDLMIEDNGIMASVFADYSVIESVLAKSSGYVSAANINSPSQTVIGGETKAVEETILRLKEMGVESVKLPVTHAFHTKIVAPAAPRLRKILQTMEIQPPRIPIISNVTGSFYPQEGNVKTNVLDLLEQQVMSPVKFIQGIETLYTAGARIFVEIGPKKVLTSLTSEILGKRPNFAIYANHPKKEEMTAFAELLAFFYSQGIGITQKVPVSETISLSSVVVSRKEIAPEVNPKAIPIEVNPKAIPIEVNPKAIPIEPVDISSIKKLVESVDISKTKRQGEFADILTTKKSMESVDISTKKSGENSYLELGQAVGQFLEQMQTFQNIKKYSDKQYTELGQAIRQFLEQMQTGTSRTLQKTL